MEIPNVGRIGNPAYAALITYPGCITITYSPYALYAHTGSVTLWINQ